MSKKLCRNILIKWHKDTLSSCYYAIAHRWQRIIFVNMLNYYGNKHFFNRFVNIYTHMMRKRKTIVTSSHSFTIKRKRKHKNWDEQIIKKIFRRNDNNYYEDVINVQSCVAIIKTTTPSKHRISILSHCFCSLLLRSISFNWFFWDFSILICNICNILQT